MFSPQSVISIDIETTGLDPGKTLPGSDIESRIWSFGVSEKTGKGRYRSHEVFLTNSNRLKEWDILKQNKFYAENKVSSDFFTRNINDMTKEGKIIFEISESPDQNKRQAADAINKTMETLGFDRKNGMVLIQNSGFERRWLGDMDKYARDLAMGGLSIIDNLSEISASTQTKSLYRPAEVTNILNMIKQESSINKRDALYDKMMQAYQKADDMANSHGRMYVADLMDFTRATFTKAAAGGFIGEEFSRYGHNVDFLSQLLLKEREIHGAGSDSLQQVKIFDKLMKIHGELSGGNVSKETQEIFDKMKSVSGLLREQMGARSLLSNIDKINTSGTFDASIPFGIREYDVISEIDDSVQKVYTTGSKRLYGESALSKIISEISQYHGSSSAEAALNINNNGTDLLDKVSMMKNPEVRNAAEEALSRSTSVMESILLEKNMSPEDVAYAESISNKNVQAEIIKTSSDLFYHEKIKRLPIIGDFLPNRASHGYAALALGGLASAYLIFGDSDGDKERVREIKDRQHRLRENQYSEDVFMKYSSGITHETMQIGKPNADWNNRIGHHEYQ